MNGEDFVKILTEDFSVSIGAATKSQWRAKSDISPTILKNALNALAKQTISSAIKPIVEFTLSICSMEIMLIPLQSALIVSM